MFRSPFSPCAFVTAISSHSLFLVDYPHIQADSNDVLWRTEQELFQLLSALAACLILFFIIVRGQA